jgi:hypothetical protein
VLTVAATAASMAASPCDDFCGNTVIIILITSDKKVRSKKTAANAEAQIATKLCGPIIISCTRLQNTGSHPEVRRIPYA